MAKIIRLKETDSTNRYLRSLLKTDRLEEGSIVTAETQTAGKGQAGNIWEAETGKNITCSVVLYPDFISIENQFIISKIAALAVADVLAELIPDVKIKWSNDVYYRDKKIAGILIENDVLNGVIETSIIGIGININQEIFRSNAPNPVSVRQITDKEYDLDDLLKQLIKSLLRWYNCLIDDERELIHQSYSDKLFRKEGYHPYRAKGKVFFAEIAEIQPSGHLVLKTKEGEKRIFAFKEVEFIK